MAVCVASVQWLGHAPFFEKKSVFTFYFLSKKKSSIKKDKILPHAWKLNRLAACREFGKKLLLTRDHVSSPMDHAFT